ncbi:MAG: cyanophycinase [Saprospiraceae bacterium]|nr:cyanophycinase [Saprospiraceae bacterium]
MEVWAQHGSLFIIGGGDRPPSLMRTMIDAAELSSRDHIVILTMSSADPDTSYYYILQDLQPFCQQVIAKLQFAMENAQDKTMLDSLRSAKLIFITGGVQSRFMDVVLNTPIYTAIHEAYDRGAMIAGTSAGAAVMSREMITGEQWRADTLYSGAVDRMVRDNIQIAQGLGLLTSAIIDQHFVKRSRYNRLLTVLNQYPGKTCIGIDEETAILVKGHTARVYGESQVIVMKNPRGTTYSKDKKLRMEKATLSILTEGDRFKL